MSKPVGAWRSNQPQRHGCWGPRTTGPVTLQGPTGGQGVPVCAGCEGAVRERLEAVVGGMSQRRPGGQRKAVPERTG